MKKLVCIAFLLLAAVLCFASCGKDENPQGLAFHLKDDGTYAVEIGEAKYLSKIEIPSTYNGKAVTEVGFFGSHHGETDKLKEIIIPDSVTTIGNYAFNQCIALASVTIPDSVTTIGDYAFYNCDALTTVTIGNGVKSIGDSTFASCSALTSVTIPDSVTSIGDRAFEVCHSLTSVTIPDSVTTIGYMAFCNCSALTSVTIGNSVTSIYNSAFAGCKALSTVTFKNPNGWWYAERADATSGTSIPAAELADVAIAASYLRYDDWYLYRD